MDWFTPSERAAIVAGVALLAHMWSEGRYVPPEVEALATNDGKVKELRMEEALALVDRLTKWL